MAWLKNSEGARRLLGVRPLLFYRWLCRPLACDGRRVSVHPRYAGHVFDHYVNLGSPPPCGACVGAALDKRVIPAMRGVCWSCNTQVGHPRYAGLPVAAPSVVVYCSGVGVGLSTCFYVTFNASCFSRVHIRVAVSCVGLPPRVLYRGLFIHF